jgi:hypothetical protein
MSASFESARSRGENVLYPFGLAAVGERDDEAIRRSKHVHWSSVEFARFPPQMRENAETRKPTSKYIPVIRLVNAMLILASHRLRNRIMTTPDAAMAMIMMAPALMCR